MIITLSLTRALSPLSFVLISCRVSAVGQPLLLARSLPSLPSSGDLSLNAALEKRPLAETK